MKRPLLPVACLLAGGILCDKCANPPLLLMFGLSFAVCLAALLWERGRPWLLGLLVFLTGWTGADRQSSVVSPNDLRLLLNGHPQLVTLRGTILAPPSQRIFERGQEEYWYSTALINVREITINNSTSFVRRAAYGKVVAGVKGILPTNVFEGQNIEVTGVIQSPNGPYARGMFDAKAFFEHENVFFQLHTQSPDDWVSPPAPLPIAERFRQWARHTLSLGLTKEDEALRLTWTLVLDWKAPLNESVEEPFLRAGTFHIFAVDGLRIGLMAGISLAFLRLLRLPRSRAGALTLPILWLYAGLTGWPASAVRAAIMASVVILGWACRRPVDLINSLLAAAVIILLWDPAQLFQAGFQLSFLVVLCIAVVLPKVQTLLRDRLFKRDPFLPDALQTRWPVPIYSSAVFVVDTATMSLAAWIASIPLAAYYFHLFTLASVPANCVVVPATALALMSAMGSLLTGAWLPSAAVLFNKATWLLMKFIIWFSQTAAAWPSAYENVASPSPGFCVFYYAVFLLAATGWIFRARYKLAVWGALTVIGLALLVQWVVDKRVPRLDVLSGGGAPVIMAEAAWEKAVLIDCGKEQFALERLKPFLCAQGVNTLGGFGLAVGLANYFGGARVILTNFAVPATFEGAPQDRSVAFDQLLRELRQRRGNMAAKDGDIIDGWTVLHPAATDHFSQADDNAVVLRREFYDHAVLLLPALGRDGQDALMQRHPDLRAEIVIAGLPAKDDPLCEPLLDMMRPGVIVLDDAESPATRRAVGKLRDRLARHHAPVFYGHENGSMTLELRPNHWALLRADGSPATEFKPAKDLDNEDTGP